VNQRAIAAGYWLRALDDLRVVALTGEAYAEATASRCYYAAFHAASAWFALQGLKSTKHEAIRSAVHRELVKAGRWSLELGARYDWLMTLRHVGDYAAERRVPVEDAREAIQWARRFVEAVHELDAVTFALEPGDRDSR
jgi:uncharacterized protein (UPF0332 family)